MIPGSRVCFLFTVSAIFAADPALTIYNQNFGIVRETVPLNLRQGENPVRFTGTTSFVEPESVILRDPSGRVTLQILEQNYRSDPISMEALLTKHEGQELDFLVQRGEKTEIVHGRLIRAGGQAVQQWDPEYGYPPPQPGQPIVLIDGKLRFHLPGAPLFPALSGDAILQPELEWILRSAAAARFDAELSYVTSGMSWAADYNLVSPAADNALDLTGWVTLENRSGKSFENARIKLMAGEVRKIQARLNQFGRLQVGGGISGGIPLPPPVTENTFDEYHLYTLQRPTTLRDRQTKQVEFVRAAGVASKTLYVYDGAKIEAQRYQGWQAEAIRNDPMYGALSNPKVWVMREFVNSEGNHLGMPLPKGRLRFYRRDSDGRLEFTGEDQIRHTPRGETIRVFTGAAFDLAGERRRTAFQIDHGRSTADESFEIKVRNHKKEAVEVRVVEHLYRWSAWQIHTQSMPHAKTDAQTAEWRLSLQPEEEKTLTYGVRYTW